jgi:hypothetical protein
MSDEATNGAKTLAEALLAVQSELPTAIHKDAENPHFRSRYVTLDGLLAVTRPALNKHGIVLMQWPERADDGELVLTTRLTHAAAGESHETSMVLLPPKGDPQGQGSAITYARRYSLMAILGLAADDDDDGNAGSNGERAEGPKRAPFKTCPKCGKAAVIKGKPEFGGGYVCWKREGGCGSKFPDGAFDQQPVTGDVPADTDGLDQPPLTDDVPWESGQ